MDFGSDWGWSVCHLTTHICVLCALISWSHPPRTLPICLSSIPGEKGFDCFQAGGEGSFQGKWILWVLFQFLECRTSLLLLVMSRWEDQLLIILLEFAEHISPTTFSSSDVGWSLICHSIRKHIPHQVEYMGAFPCYKYNFRIRVWNGKIPIHRALCNGRQSFHCLPTALGSDVFVMWEFARPFIRSSSISISQRLCPKILVVQDRCNLNSQLLRVVVKVRSVSRLWEGQLDFKKVSSYLLWVRKSTCLNSDLTNSGHVLGTDPLIERVGLCSH